jgi:cytochrome c5
MSTKKLLISLIMLTIISWVAGVVFAQDYIIIGWNDLGMHCANKNVASFCVLPPYNNVHAQVIKTGTAATFPQIVTADVRVTYEIPGNSYSVGKTDFWSYEDKLFGVSLADNIGLKGAGLTGELTAKENYFLVEGIPITPYTDADLTTEDPYQLALLTLYNSSTTVLATTQPVIPVSNEINCVSSGCHSSEQDILNEHEDEGGFNANNKPILCASCHGSNALGTTSKPGLKSLSETIHGKHKGKTNDCYKCHPGTHTKCLRDIMYQKGFTCQRCHGDLPQVAQSIRNGRRPWLDEPKCGATECHGSNYAEESGKLFRESKGHGGLFCSACHGAPHAIVPTVVDRDNVQNVALQGFEGTLKKCVVCHGVTPAGGGPHGLTPTEVQAVSNTQPATYALLQNYPNPFNPSTKISFHIQEPGRVHLDIYDTNGRKQLALVNQYVLAGEYQVEFQNRQLPSGTYIYQLTVNGFTASKKMMILK